MGKSSGKAINDFTADEAFSKSTYADQFWNAFYRSAFGDFIRMSESIADHIIQKRGIDRKVYCTNGTLLIDEKLRRLNFTGDVFLEYISRDTGRVPGWLNKEMDIDYIAYGWYPSKMGYLIEWQSLTAAWFIHGDDWMKKYPKKGSQNAEYTTWGVCVPTGIIRDTTNCRFITFDRFDSVKSMESEITNIQLSMF